MLTFTTNIVDVANRLKEGWLSSKKQRELNEDIAYTLKNSIVYRIHSQGQASDGSSIGTYSPRYAEWRNRMGMQTSYVDLKVYGNLRDSFVVEERDGGVYAIGFDNATDADKSRYMEEHFGKDIWEPTTDELARVERLIRETINNV